MNAIGGALKRAIVGVIILSIPNLCFASITALQEVSTTYYHVLGATQNSFYPKSDTDILYEGVVDSNGEFSEGLEFSSSMYYRMTNDKLVDDKDVSMENFWMSFSRPSQYEYTLGDFFASYSDFSVGNAIKGVKMDWETKYNLNYGVVGGIDTAKWEDLWETRVDDSAEHSYVWGAHLGSNFFQEKLSLSLNYGGKLDDKAYLQDYMPQIFVNVLSIDTEYEFARGLVAKFEAAKSFTDQDKRLDYIGFRESNAYNASFNIDDPHYNIVLGYQRIGIHFNNTSGFVASDIERFTFDDSINITPNTRFTSYFHFDRDDLADHADFTTRQLNPGAGLEFKLPYEIDCETRFDLRKRYTSDDNTKEKTYTYSTRVGKEFKYVNCSVEYIKTFIVDRIWADQERNEDSFYIDLDGVIEIKDDISLSWNVGEDFTHSEYKDICESDLTLNHRFGGRLDLPDMLFLSTQISLHDNNYFMNDTDNHGSSYLFSLGKDIKDLSLSLDYQYRGYNYVDGDDNYSEEVLTGKASYQF
ncbi:hypothetical protein ACFL0T_01240 [Candidatus Omnitrophota bacterium]